MSAHPRGRRVARVLAWLFFAAAALGVVAYEDAAAYALTISIASFAPYLMLAAVPALLGFGLGRHWLGLVLSVAVLIFLVVVTLPLFVAQSPPRGARDLRVLTVNARLGQADPTAIVRVARTSRADLVMVEELTPALQAELVRDGLTRLLPNNRSRPGAASTGTGLWSRYPLQDAGTLGLSQGSVVARVRVPGLSQAPTVVALHVDGPFPVATGWESDMASLPGKLRRLPSDAPVIVGGDFNATYTIGPFRALLDDGYDDAGDQAGAGFLLTYPMGSPVIGIDHVLTRGAVGRSARTVSVPGSDHRALLATVAVPRTS